MKILITGSQGFIGSYLCDELLNHGYEVIGVDNYSKYGKLNRSHDFKNNFKLYECDIINYFEFERICFIEKPDIIIAGAAMIGGISYFHRYAYDLLATNERILASTFDSAIKLFKKNILNRIIVLSSSMVYENTDKYPTPENEVKICPPPLSTYGFQKLSSEYFAKGAWEQYNLPYTIVRPFNCVGVGEDKALDAKLSNENNDKLMLSHVLPDLVNKTLSGQDPLEILGSGSQIRCYTHGKDIARAMRLIIESDMSLMEDFNISTSISTSVLELAKMIWEKINFDKKFNYKLIPGFDYDVQKRIPDTSKAKQLLGFEAAIGLNESIDEVIQYMKEQKK